MANIVISGDSSGSVTLSAPAVSGTTVLTLPTTSGTLVVTGGAQTIEFADGTVSAPSITNSGDTNTGIYFPAADTIAFTEGGVESMRIDASGNVGIGTTSPSIGLTVVKDNGSGYVASFRANTSSPALTIQTTGGITQIQGINSAFTDVANIAFQPSGGNVGIGTSSPSYKLHVVGSGTGAQARIESTSTANAQLSFVNTSATGGFVIGLLNNTSGDALIYHQDAKPIGFYTSGTERMRIDSSGDVVIGATSAIFGARFGVKSSNNTLAAFVGNDTAGTAYFVNTNGSGQVNHYATYATSGVNCYHAWWVTTSGGSQTQAMTLDVSGNLLVGTTSTSTTTVGIRLLGSLGIGEFTASSDLLLTLNRLNTDGDLVRFRQDNSTEGSISVSGSTVSYNGGHLARWSQLPDGSKDETILKGTVLTNLDDMCVWVKDGETLPNEQLNKMQVSSVEGDTNVAGVFVNWTRDEDCNSDDMNVAMTGDMIIRIADGVVVQKGDLLMSAGDGTAKPQGDDIVRSKTIAKVTSNYVTCTYADGSYCVPCVLMAC